MEATFSTGDKVVHPGKGAGVVTEYRTLGQGEHARQYLIIDLKDGHNSVLMLPVDRLEEIGLRPVLVTLELAEEVMNEVPGELDGNHRVRQAELEEELKSGDARVLLCALRNLHWREYLSNLTGADRKLLSRIRKQLVRELALATSTTPAIAKTNLQSIIDAAIETHSARVQA